MVANAQQDHTLRLEHKLQQVTLHEASLSSARHVQVLHPVLDPQHGQ